MSDRLGRMGLAAIDDERHLAPDHQLGEVLLVGLGRDALADDLAAPDDRDPVGDLEDLVELVADEDDAVALGREAPEDLEDLLGLLRRQDRGRLVEDEDLGVPVERLEDLDALLPADGQGADLGVGVDLEAEPAAELHDPAVRLLAVEEDRSGHRLLAEDDVLGDGQDRDEHEVLVDHADAAGDGVRGTGQVDLLAVEQDLALVGRGEAVEDVHEGGLAGAVLAEQGVDLAGPDLEVDVGVGNDARIALRDAAHLERGRANRRRRWPFGIADRFGVAGHRGDPSQVHLDTTSGPAGVADPLVRSRQRGSVAQREGVLRPAVRPGRSSSVPAFMAARASSTFAWVSAASLLAAS